MKVRFHPEARAEFKEAALYYGQVEEGLSDRFVEAVDLAIQSIQASPQRWPILVDNVHRRLVRLFQTQFWIPSRQDPSSLLPSCIPIGSPSTGSPDLQVRWPELPKSGRAPSHAFEPEIATGRPL